MPSHSKSRPVSAAALRRRQILVGGSAAVIVIAVVLIFVLGGGGKKSPHGQTVSSLGLPPGATQPAIAKDNCPLTDEPAAGGTVPERAPIAVKIGNEPGPDAGGLGAARPQSGLNEADVVYDTPAEGGIMRYVAVYQCSGASKIGPVRSYRWVDARVLAVFRHSILAHVGGIGPNLSELNSFSYVKNVDDDCGAEPTCYPSVFNQDPNRVPPDATYTSTQALWSQFHSAPYNEAPQPIFRYTSALPAAASPISQVGINFSPGTDVVWQWSPSAHAFEHFYGTTPDIDQLDQQQVSAQNIFIQIVSYKIGPYEESSGIAGSGDVESQTLGTGTGYLLRNGRMLKVTWHRAALQDPTTFTDAAGKAVGLAPGRTWVEMVLNSTARAAGGLSFTK